MIPSSAPDARSGFALVEVMIAIAVIGISLLVLLQIRNQALHTFVSSGDQFSASWLAELKMNELVSQDLPDPKDNETWELSGSGDFSEFDNRFNELNRRFNEDWEERYSYYKFEYEWTKELVFVGPDFIGSQYDLDEWEVPVDERGQELLMDDPREKPAVRVVRVTLTVYLPEDSTTRAQSASSSSGSGSQSQVQTVNGRPAIQLVTYVDPNILFTAVEEEAQAAEAENTTPENTGNNTGTGE